MQLLTTMNTQCYWAVSSRILLALAVLLCPVTVVGSEDRLDVSIVHLTRAEIPRESLSLLDVPIEDRGRQGTQLGFNDNQTTGNFINQYYQITEVVLAEDADLSAAFQQQIAKGNKLFIADLDADDLLLIADIDPDTLILSIRATDDFLRNEGCRVNVLHIPPSRSMIADALVQYLAWKRWNKAVLVTGRHANDKAYSNALKRAAGRFGIKIVQEKKWTAVAGARRTDAGHYSLQQEVPVFTQFKKHDILLVADEQDEFGEYLIYRTTQPRPVAGTQGLIATSWHRTQEQWGATQIQRRFEKLAGRTMTVRDYSAWAAMRTLGEAVTQVNSAEPQALKSFILSSQFKLAGFKGVPLTFRTWNGQLRQPVLLVAPRMLITVSPQPGFLHERSLLDTLGFDKPESTCSAF